MNTMLETTSTPRTTERGYQRALKAQPRLERSGIPTRRYVAFGQRMAQAVREAGIAETQEALGKVLGFAQVTVGAWLRGDKLPPIERGVRIAKTCGVCVEWLYTGNGPKYPLPNNQVLQIAQELSAVKPEILGCIRAILDTAKRETND